MDSDSDCPSDASSVDMEEFQALLRSQGTKAVKKSCINNVEGLEAKIMTLAESSSGEHSMTCVVEHEQEEAVDVHDDFKREEHFMCLAKRAVGVVLPRLAAAGVPIQRPSDYFAEMVKSDEHMKKIKAKLLSEQQGIEQSEKARKQRELKKFGKKVQHEVLEKRRKEKRDALDSVKQMRTKSKSREMRDEKFGFGGKKRAGKRNNGGPSPRRGGASARGGGGGDRDGGGRGGRGGGSRGGRGGGRGGGGRGGRGGGGGRGGRGGGRGGKRN